MRRRSIVAAGGAAGIALVFGWGLSLATTRVKNWFVMTDELFYERLAVSVAQTGSLLPRIHGDVISNVNQLYPVLLSFLFGDANVPESLEAVHRLNAFLMASAAVPVYLLARSVTVGRLVSLLIGALSVAVPWVVLSSFLLTEAVAYPVFCWALLAISLAVARRSASTDVLALVAIAVAVLARTQFVILIVVLGVAVLADAILSAASDGSRGRDLFRSAAAVLLRTRRTLVAAALAGMAAAVVVAVAGDSARLLGSYAVTAEGIRVDLDLLHLAADHVAVLALSLAIVPFLLACGWLVDRLRPSAPVAERALATVGCATLILLTLEVASFNQRFGAGLVKDRYLFYVVPVLLVALAAAVASERWPRWWTILVPGTVCVVGFASLRLPTYEKLNVDSPVAILNDELLRLATSRSWAQVALVGATLVAAQILILGPLFLPRRALAVSVIAVATVALPSQAVYAFDRLFAVDGTNGLPITLDQGGVFNWVDRAVGADGRVTMVRYPLNATDYWAGYAYWWDAEFWNESVVDEAYIGDGFPEPESWTYEFDRRTGAALRLEETPYLLIHQTDVRFRLAGRNVVFDRGAYLFRPDRPWRAAFVTHGIYGDGWTRPDTRAAIKVFARPGQRTPLRRFLTIALASPEPSGSRGVTIASNLMRWEGEIPANASVDRRASVCVPAGGHATVTIDTPSLSNIYRDPSKGQPTGENDRPVGVLLRWIALADETQPVARCPSVRAHDGSARRRVA